MVEKKLRDFHARVFLHELDHINGYSMTHWRLSEGNIDIMDGKEDINQNLMTTVDFYKSKIADMKEQHPTTLFTDNRKFKETETEDK